MASGPGGGPEACRGWRRGCRVFDDLLSILHLALGLLSALLFSRPVALLVFILYVAYESVEGFYRRDCPAADVVEYVSGVGFGYLLKIAVGA